MKISEITIFRKRVRLRGWRVVTLFLAAYFLTAAAINVFARSHLPVPYMGSFTLKTWFFEREKDIDFVFLGTSRYDTGIDPEAFDTEMAQLGCRVRSFNMGIDGLNPIEACYLIHWIREKRPHQPMRLVIGQLEARHNLTMGPWDRTRFFNTWSNLPLFVRDIWRLPRLKRDRLVTLMHYLGTFAYEQTGVGRLSRFFFPDRQGKFDTNTIGGVRGYVPAAKELPLEKRQEMADGIKKAIAEIDVWREDYSKRNGQGHMARIVPLVQEARSLGFSVGVMLSPSILIYALSDPLQNAMAMEHPDIPVWNYANPKKYPEFFEAVSLNDGTHLGPYGAKLLAKIMAKDICPVLLRGEL